MQCDTFKSHQMLICILEYFQLLNGPHDINKFIFLIDNVSVKQTEIQKQAAIILLLHQFLEVKF